MIYLTGQTIRGTGRNAYDADAWTLEVYFDADRGQVVTFDRYDDLDVIGDAETEAEARAICREYFAIY